MFLKSEGFDIQTVQETRKALDAGLLDTPGNAEAAAADILKYGI